MPRTALAHIVLGVDFEEVYAMAAGEGVGFMRGLEAETNTSALEWRLLAVVRLVGHARSIGQVKDLAQ